jgi:L-amino acid N-acyltransferase YncA
MIYHGFKTKDDQFLFLSKEINSELARNTRNLPDIRDWCRENDVISPQAQEKWFASIGTDNKNLMYSIHTCKLEAGDDKSLANSLSNQIGVCGLTNINWFHRTAEWSLYISTLFQSNGCAESALKTLIKHGFDSLNLNRIWGDIFSTNTKCIQLAEKIGFTKEGELRNSYYKNGKYINSIIVSMLKEECKL